MTDNDKPKIKDTSERIELRNGDCAITTPRSVIERLREKRAKEGKPFKVERENYKLSFIWQFQAWQPELLPNENEWWVWDINGERIIGKYDSEDNCVRSENRVWDLDDVDFKLIHPYIDPTFSEKSRVTLDQVPDGEECIDINYRSVRRMGIVVQEYRNDQWSKYTADPNFLVIRERPNAIQSLKNWPTRLGHLPDGIYAQCGGVPLDNSGKLPGKSSGNYTLCTNDNTLIDVDDNEKPIIFGRLIKHG